MTYMDQLHKKNLSYLLGQDWYQSIFNAVSQSRKDRQNDQKHPSSDKISRLNPPTDRTLLIIILAKVLQRLKVLLLSFLDLLGDLSDERKSFASATPPGILTGKLFGP